MLTMPDTLDAIIDDIWQRLGRGSKDRRSPFHTPVVANVTPDGAPSQRVMVLRAADRQERLLRFHTDSRSAKAMMIGEASPVSVLGYDPGAKLQFRLSGLGRIEQNGPVADTAWQSSTLFARRCYMAEAAPGSQSDGPTSGLPEFIEGRQPEAEDILPARPNFAVLLVTLTEIDWLYLSNDGHRRARFVFDQHSAEWRAHWLIP